MIHLTFDQDWAPDWAVQDALELLRQNNLVGTFFVTHSSPLLNQLRKQPKLELGWHPNFLAKSSHGSSTEEVLATLKQWVPKAMGVRTHQLVRSTPLLRTFAHHRLLYEASDLLMGLSCITPILDPSGLVRIGIAWEDDVHLAFHTSCDFSEGLTRREGCAVFNFHPTLLALNACDLKSYEALKTSLQKKKRPLHEATREEFAAFRQNQRAGVMDLFQGLLTWLIHHPECAGGTLGEVAQRHLQHHQKNIQRTPRVWQKSVRVCLTSVGNEAIHGFASDLRSQAPQWHLIGTDVRSDAAGLYVCDERFLTALRSHEDFLSQLQGIIKKSHADILLPLSTADQDFFCRPKIQKALGIPIVVSSEKSLQLANRKIALFEGLAHHADFLPDHEVVNDPLRALDALKGFVQKHGAAFLKADQGTGGAGMLAVGSPERDPAPAQGRRWWSLEEIEAWLDLSRSREGIKLPSELRVFTASESSTWPRLAVAYLPGDEYSVDVLAQEGKSIASVVRLRTAATGGLALVSEIVDAPDVRLAAEEVIRTLGLSYVNNVQFRRDAEGKPQLIEVNPRIPGTISLTVQAGLNLPLAACCLRLGDTLPLPQPQIGLRVMRHFGNIYTTNPESRHG